MKMQFYEEFKIDVLEASQECHSKEVFSGHLENVQKVFLRNYKNK